MNLHINTCKKLRKVKLVRNSAHSEGCALPRRLNSGQDSKLPHRSTAAASSGFDSTLHQHATV